MAIVNLTKRTIGESYAYTETIADGTNGDTIIIPAGDKNITLTAICGSNTGKFQFTTSQDEDVLDGSCTWIDWSDGDVTGTNYSVIQSQITGLRGVSVSGEITIEVVR